MPTRILRKDHERSAWVKYLQAQDLPITVSCLAGAKRSLAQNATAAMWYGQISGWMGDTPADEVKARCKKQFGLPIMQRDQVDWCDKYLPMFEAMPTYEAEIELWRIVPLTSLLNVKQMAEYMNAIQQYFLPLGCRLTDPDALKYGAELVA